ncbi:MAG: tRNA pseudouridine(38-40) synthase TruA [Gammaproteobacteria bacterium]|nr:tRNA pseudouridine(38-40) synthase TruA [Gammaproteobacteria bacterium]
MVKYAVGVEYSGTAYCGWQRQPHCSSVQQNLESALGFVADHPLELVCAGRTDSGVHAIEQVAHFEAHVQRSERAWVLGANCRLPRDIRVKWVVPVEDEFHARFSARSRAYRYIILNAVVPSAIFHDRACWELKHLDQNVMHDCAQIIVGEHDFSSFRAAGCQSKSAHRKVHEISISRVDELVYLDVTANAFLYHMVRNLAGSLIAVGRGDRDSKWFQQVFQAGDRNLAEVTAPAAGLYLLHATYDAKFKLPNSGKKPVLF